MIRISRLPADTLIVGSYTTMILLFSWLTITGHFDDALTGALALALMAFPLSIAGGLLYDPLRSVLGDDQTGALQPIWEYVLIAWPGLFVTVLLALLLRADRTRTIGHAVGGLLSMAVAVAGLLLVFSEWPPDRPAGLLPLAGSLAMTIGLSVGWRRPRVDPGRPEPRTSAQSPRLGDTEDRTAE